MLACFREAEERRQRTEKREGWTVFLSVWSILMSQKSFSVNPSGNAIHSCSPRGTIFLFGHRSSGLSPHGNGQVGNFSTYPAWLSLIQQTNSEHASAKLRPREYRIWCIVEDVVLLLRKPSRNLLLAVDLAIQPCKNKKGSKPAVQQPNEEKFAAISTSHSTLKSPFLVRGFVQVCSSTGFSLYHVPSPRT